LAETPFFDENLTDCGLKVTSLCFIGSTDTMQEYTLTFCSVVDPLLPTMGCCRLEIKGFVTDDLGIKI